MLAQPNPANPFTIGEAPGTIIMTLANQMQLLPNEKVNFYFIKLPFAPGGELSRCLDGRKWSNSRSFWCPRQLVAFRPGHYGAGLIRPASRHCASSSDAPSRRPTGLTAPVTNLSTATIAKTSSRLYCSTRSMIVR